MAFISNYTPVLPDHGDWLLHMHRRCREKSQDPKASHSRHPMSRDSGHFVLIFCYIDTSSRDGIYGLCYIHGPPNSNERALQRHCFGCPCDLLGCMFSQSSSSTPPTQHPNCNLVLEQLRPVPSTGWLRRQQQSCLKHL